MNFMEIIKEYDDKENVTIRPYFVFRKNEEIVIKDGKFYALWNPDNECWIKDLYDVAEVIDKHILKFADEECEGEHGDVYVDLCKYYDSGVMKRFLEYCSCLSDNFYGVYTDI